MLGYFKLKRLGATKTNNLPKGNIKSCADCFNSIETNLVEASNIARKLKVILKEYESLSEKNRKYEADYKSISDEIKKDVFFAKNNPMIKKAFEPSYQGDQKSLSKQKDLQSKINKLNQKATEQQNDFIKLYSIFLTNLIASCKILQRDTITKILPSLFEEENAKKIETETARIAELRQTNTPV